MKELFDNLITDKKKNVKNNHYIVYGICCIIFAAFILIGISPGTAKAASGLKLYDYSTKKTTTYTDKQIIVTLNGATVKCSGTPGILVGGTAVLPYNEIFETSGIAADCSFNETKGKITISKYDKTIVMTIDSKTATVNGKKVTMSTAPKKVKYVASNKTKILVPSRFVSETLGLGYSWNSDKSTVSITKKTILLSYNGGDESEYSGAQGKVTIDGKSVSLGNMPSIIVNNTAMLRANMVFAVSQIDADYLYNKADKSVTLSKNGNVVVMTIGSKTAFVNSKEVTLSTAPILVKNCETNCSYVYVPGSFTAASLGFDYTWNNSTRTSVITVKSSNNDPELGDSGNITETGTVLNEWIASDALYKAGNDIHDLNKDAASTNIYGTIYSVSRDFTNTVQNSETFMVQATSPYNKLLSSSSGNIISIISDNELCSTQSYQLYGVNSNLINTLALTNHTDAIGTTIELSMLSDHFHYDLSLSADRLTLYVTVYYNALTSAKLGSGSDGDYLVLTGLDALHATVTQAAGSISIDLPYTFNSIGDITTAVAGSKYILQYSTVSMPDRTRLTLVLNAGYQCNYIEKDNKFTLTLESENTPVVIDKSEYELIIPKPATVTSSMISDTDHYLSNYFVILLQGDYTSVLNSDMITNQASNVSKIAVTLNSSGNTEIKISTSKLQGYLIASDNENIYVNVGNPRDIYKNIVVLDPGHGGSATGAIHNGVYEKNLNLEILYTIGQKYFNQDTTTLKVYYTRTSDADISLMDRANFASKVGADLFVSLHMNAASNAPSASGSEVFYSKLNNSANSSGLTSKIMAGIILNNLYPAIGTGTRGVKEEALVVDKYNTVPAVLIELGFITNSSDFSIITDEAKQELAVSSIYNSLLQIFDKYPTGR
jgi:N-acetylmuramoyl-L-alanine amidase